MSVGRDIREQDLLLRPAPVAGGLEPQLLGETQQSVLAEMAARAATYTPEWTDRRPEDAGVAIVAVQARLAQTAHQRLNRIPRRLAHDWLRTAGVRALPATPAIALAAVELTDRAVAPLDVPAGTVFVTPAGPSGPVLETAHGCTAVPGRIAAVAVLADGWVALDRGDKLGGLPPFGAHSRPPAELWLGVDTSVSPRGVLSVAVELVPAPGRPVARAQANQPIAARPLLRWEAMSAGRAIELAVEFDETRGLDRTGVIAFRIPAEPEWTAALRPGQTTGTPLRWLRARLLTSTFGSAVGLGRVLLNGVRAEAARSVRQEVAEPVERRPTGGSRFRLAVTPVLPGSVVLDVTETATGLVPGAPAGRWTETNSLTAAQPDDRVFLLDPETGTLTFGDGVHGRAVPEGYRNVVARRYRTGGGTVGLPAPGDLLPGDRSVPDLVGLRIVSITTGSPAESAHDLLRRGPGEIRSRLRAVAAADYAVAALSTAGVDIARASCLPSQDPATGSTRAGTVGVVVVPRVADHRQRPIPSAETLQVVAEHLASRAGVVGARVVAVAPRYRELSVQGLLVGSAGADLATVLSTARDRIDEWLSPLVGGDGTGWPFGEPVRWKELVRMLLERVPNLEAASRVSFRVDGRRLPTCADAVLNPGELVWPVTHLLEGGGFS